MLSRSSSAYQPLGGASDNSRHRHDHTEVRPKFFRKFREIVTIFVFSDDVMSFEEMEHVG